MERERAMENRISIKAKLNLINDPVSQSITRAYRILLHRCSIVRRLYVVITEARKC